MKRAPVYLKVKEYLRKEIEKGKGGERLCSQTLLSHRFKTSHMTVRRALKELEQEGLISLQRGKGTFIRERKKGPGTLNVLCFFPRYWRDSELFCLPILQGILEESTSVGIAIHVCTFLEDAYQTKDFASGCDFGGVICVAPEKGNLRIMEEWSERGYAVMAVNRVIKNSWLSFVSTDHKRGMKEIMGYFLGKGYRRIGFVGLGGKQGNIIFQRFHGFRESLEEVGAEVKEEAVVLLNLTEELSRDLENLESKVKTMLENYMPEAIVVSRGSLLGATISAIKKEGLKIPEDIEIAAYDEIRDKYDEKEFIHEIIQPLSLMGKMAVREIKRVIGNEERIIRITLPPLVKIKKVGEEKAAGAKRPLVASQENCK